MTVWHNIQIAFTAIGAIIGAALGGFDGFMYALCILMITDYITGVIEAGYSHEISSKIGFKGILKKILMFVVIAVAHLIDTYVIHTPGMLRTATIFFYVSNEGISILENISLCGVAIPKKLQSVLKQMNKKEKFENPDERNDDNEGH